MSDSAATSVNVAELRRLLKSASPIPWQQMLHGNEYPFPLTIHTSDGEYWVARDGYAARLADVDLIVAAINALPALLDCADDELRSRLEETEYRLEDLRVSAKALQEHHDAVVARQSRQIQAIYDAWRKALGVAEKLDIDAAVAKHDAEIRGEHRR